MRNELDYSKDGGQETNGNFWKGWFRYQIDPSEYEKNLILILPALEYFELGKFYPEIKSLLFNVL